MLLLLLSFAPFLLFFSKSAGASPIFLFRKYLAAARLALGSMRVATRESGGADEVVAEEAADGEMSVLDLPELALDCILERLPPAGLCNMSAVCSSLKDRCRSDHLWGGHMREKWGHVMGRAVTEEWRRFAASRTEAAEAGKLRGLAGMISRVLPASWARAMHMAKRRQTSSLPADSAMSCYLALESGKFWLPAQVYNRENGHSGFMLSCYDAELSYNWRTDKFQARYPPHGKRPVVLEDDITWDRIRAPPVDTSPHDLHISDCLDDLRPGDHFEIQWRRNKEFPYGWWYGVVGHLESCGGSKLTCWCHKSDTIALEFNHYAAGSRWRRGVINRKDHREGGSETDGFYGGIRKIESKEEISTWRRLWPADGME